VEIYLVPNTYTGPGGEGEGRAAAAAPAPEAPKEDTPPEMFK
jgi:hypothetical protein